MSEDNFTSIHLSHRHIFSMATSALNDGKNTLIATSSSFDTKDNVKREPDHKPPLESDDDFTNAAQPTQTCTKKGKGLRDDGVCGRRLPDHEVGRNKRCYRCRDYDAELKRKSRQAIANKCGVRKHRFKQSPNVSGLPVR